VESDERTEAPAVRAQGLPRAARPPAPTQWLTVAEAAEQAGVNARTLRRAAAVGALDARRSGKVWLTTLAAVRAWRQAARHRPGPRLGQGVGRPRRTADAPAPAGPGS
jgi:excisionase family DNA binding protein